MKINYSKTETETSIKVELDKSIDISVSKVISRGLVYVVVIGGLFNIDTIERLYKLFM